MASLVWGLLWRVALAEGAAASTSFVVIGCTRECGGGSVFGWGYLPWGISNWGGQGFWLAASVGVVLAFWCFLGVYAFAALWSMVFVFSLVVHPWGLCWVT